MLCTHLLSLTLPAFGRITGKKVVIKWYSFSQAHLTMEKNKLPALTLPVAERARHPRPSHAPHQPEIPQQRKLHRWNQKGLTGIRNRTRQFPTHAITYTVVYTHTSQTSSEKYKFRIKECALRALGNRVRYQAFLVEILRKGKPSCQRANLEENKHSDTAASHFKLAGLVSHFSTLTSPNHYVA